MHFVPPRRAQSQPQKLLPKPQKNGQEPFVHSTALGLLGASIRIQKSHQGSRPVSKAQSRSKPNDKQYVNSLQMHRVLPKAPHKYTVNCSLRTPILPLMPPSNVLNGFEQPREVPGKMLFPRNPSRSTRGGDELAKQKALYRSM
ncbi:hypothetical protein PITC_065280 [Penicillium italicum]|uniref:Uncharacterized protein n=1 Tax=Penicillium italicum TaxID=40296 RepID=A0A0A2KN05_PENIT|nr:hypothetical protein PITC_065280 [Penicillium italicum]